MVAHSKPTWYMQAMRTPQNDISADLYVTDTCCPILIGLANVTF